MLPLVTIKNITIISTTNAMKNFVLFCCIIVSALCFSQATPKNLVNTSKKTIIDEYIIVSNYENALKQYIVNYLESKRTDYNVDPPKEILSQAKIDQFVKEFDFNNYKFSIYNSFSFISEENLKKLVTFYKSLNGELSNYSTLFLIDSLIDLNLKNKINYEIEILKTK